MADQMDFDTEQERDLFHAAVLGEDCREFLRTPVGRYLLHRAKIQIGQAEVDALEVDPDGWGGWFRARRKLRQIRERAAVARAFINWMAEAIEAGNVAVKELDDRKA